MKRAGYKFEEGGGTVYDLETPKGSWIGTCKSFTEAKKRAEWHLARKPHLKYINVLKWLGTVERR
jgi:hypothetical protein